MFQLNGVTLEDNYLKNINWKISNNIIFKNYLNEILYLLKSNKKTNGKNQFCLIYIEKEISKLRKKFKREFEHLKCKQTIHQYFLKDKSCVTFF